MEDAGTELREDIQYVTDAFYQNRVKEGVRRLPELVQKLADKINGLDADVQQQYLGAVKLIMEAMEEKNYIMLADVLTFDISEILEQYGY